MVHPPPHGESHDHRHEQQVADGEAEHRRTPLGGILPRAARMPNVRPPDLPAKNLRSEAGRRRVEWKACKGTSLPLLSWFSREAISLRSRSSLRRISAPGASAFPLPADKR